MILFDTSDAIYTTWCKGDDEFITSNQVGDYSMPWDWEDYHMDFDSCLRRLLKRF